MRRVLAGAALACSMGAAAAPPALVSITFENDFFADYDRHYTNGLQLAFLAGVDRFPAALRALPPLAWSADPEVVVAIGQRIYTPADTQAERPDPADRPYAGWLYAMTDVRARSEDTVDHVSVALGMVGPASLARQSQNAFHRLTGGSRARGWDFQVRNRPTAMVGYERAWPAVAHWRRGARQADLSLRAGGALGNALTYANAGAVLRYGTDLPFDLPMTHISLGPPRDGFRGTATFGWYAWAGVDARAIGRNIFIEGRTFGDASHVQLEPFGYDMQLGVAAVWPSTRVGFTLVRRSREFEGQDRSDRFGQLAVSFAY